MNHIEINSANAKPPDGLVEQWISEIRRRTPTGSSVTATVQAKSERGFLASFRVRMDEEILSSEARAASADEAVAQAGQGLCDHLPHTDGLSEDIDIPRAS